MSVLLNQGSGTFAAQTTYAVGTCPYGVATADFNGDGKADIVAANYSSNTVSVLLNQGSGTFAAQTTYAVGTSPYGVATADFNGDGKADIVAANYSSNTVSVLLNQGSGTFAAQTTYAVGSSPHGVATADFNGDGKPDIVAANYERQHRERPAQPRQRHFRSPNHLCRRGSTPMASPPPTSTAMARPISLQQTTAATP